MGSFLKGVLIWFIDGIEKSYSKGDRYYIPSGVKHSGKIHAGYADITFFNEKNRYTIEKLGSE
jgi:quercetin dioxygenase-like cupin family protein